MKPHSYIYFLLLLFLFLAGCQDQLEFNDGISAEVKFYNNRQVIHIDDVPQTPMLYALSDVPGGRWSWEEVPQHNIKAFCDQGIRLYQLDVFLEHIWIAPDSFSVALAQKQVRGVREVCPEAVVFFRFHVNAPNWWVEQYPEETTVYDSVKAQPDQLINLGRMLEADPRYPLRNSLASKKWLETTSEKLGQFCREFAQTPEGDALAGIQVASGVYGEWHYWGILKNEADFSEPMQNHFRQWLREKYETNEQLQIAWGDKKASFTTAKAPTTVERAQTSAGIFRHPVQDRKVIDYYRSQHELVADDIIHFCKVVKENWPRPIITGVFYGYFFSVFNRQAFGGHLALHQILESEYVDYLSGPQAYYPESGYQTGEPYRSRSLIHSIWLNDKLWLDEYDQQPKRTWPYLAIWDNLEEYEKNVAANVSMIRRNTLFPLLKGQGLWFYDFGPAGMHLHKENEVNDQAGTAGYWDNPVYMKSIGQLKTVADSMLERPFKSNADVLAIYDTESIMYMPSTEEKKCPVTEQVINWSTLALYYAGVVFDPIHLDDLDKVTLSQYKAVIFFNTFVLDDQDKKIIREKIATDGRHLVWIYAPGYIDGQEIDPAFVDEITGFQLDTLRSEQIPEFSINPSVGEVPSQVAAGAYDPVFYIQDNEAEIMGRFTNFDRPAFGRKQLDDHVSWYLGIPPTDYRIFHKILEDAGARIYSRDQEVIYAGGDYLMWHTTLSGTKSIPLEGKSATFEVQDTPATVLIDMTLGKVVDIE